MNPTHEPYGDLAETLESVPPNGTPPMGPPVRRVRRWAALVLLVLCWLGVFVGGVVWARGGGGQGCQVTHHCLADGHLQTCYSAGCGYGTENCTVQQGIDPACESSGGGGTACDPYAIQYCWGQPTCGGDNATNDCGQATYSSGCASGCSSSQPICTPNGKLTMKLVSCTSSCHLGTWQQYNSCGSKNGGEYTSYAGSCTRGCSSAPTCTGGQTDVNGACECPSGESLVNGTCQASSSSCSGLNGWHFASCGGGCGKGTWNYYSCGTITETHTDVNAPAGDCLSTVNGCTSGGGSAPPSSSCSPATSTNCGEVVQTGCAGSCTTAGCTQTGVATTAQSCTVTESCPNGSYSYTRTGTTSTSACQSQVEHQCAYAMPGYAQVEYCLTGPGGGLTNCSGWSTPYYDPHDCPIPTPVDY